MSSGIPPLLPAFPPPMCKVDFDDDESDNDDENEDDFGDFSTAIPNHISNSVHEENIPIDQNQCLHVITPHLTVAEKIVPTICSSPSLNHVDQIPNCMVEAPLADVIASTKTLHLENEKPKTEPIPNLFSPPTPDTTNGDHFDCDKLDGNSVREHSSTISSKSASADDLSIELVLPSCDDKIEDNTSENFYDMGFCISEITQVPGSGDQSSDSNDNDRTNSKLDLNDSSWSEIEVIKRKQDESIEESNEQVTKIVDEVVDFEQKASRGTVDDDLFVIPSKVEGPNINEQNAFESNKPQSEKIESNFAQQYFSENDDEFSDFVSPSNFVSSKPLTVSKNDSLSNDQEPSSLVFISHIENWNEIFETQLEEPVEVNLNSIEGRLNGSSVWCRIKDIHASPALNYTWAESESNKMLLSALYVDARNILFGPRWNSEVPRFASNLGFTPLIPQKTSNKKEEPSTKLTINVGDLLNNCCKLKSTFPAVIDETQSSKTVPTYVPDAHFDWNNSGLTNPLDSHTNSSLLDLDLLANFDIHSPYYKKKRKPMERDEDNRESNYENFTTPRLPLVSNGGSQQQLSREASEVLNNLPNLVVMEKQYIVFPIR